MDHSGLTATSFQLKGSKGNGAYTSGGSWFAGITTPHEHYRPEQRPTGDHRRRHGQHDGQ